MTRSSVDRSFGSRVRPRLTLPSRWSGLRSRASRERLCDGVCTNSRSARDTERTRSLTASKNMPMLLSRLPLLRPRRSSVGTGAAPFALSWLLLRVGLYGRCAADEPCEPGRPVLLPSTNSGRGSS